MEHEPIIQFEKANLIRSKLLLTTYANCMRCSKYCEGFKINCYILSRDKNKSKTYKRETL